MRVQFGRITQLMLLGGGQLLVSFAAQAREQGWSVVTVTSPRHANENLELAPIVSLRSYLDDGAFDYIVSDNVNTDSKVLNLITDQTLAISLGAAWIFKTDFIDRFSGRFVNMHGARLPQDRGGGGYSWRILRNDRLGFALIHVVVEGVDTGEIVTFEEYFFPESCRLPIDYRQHALAKNLDLLGRYIEAVKRGAEFETISQPNYLSSYWPRLNTDAHAYIDWMWSLTEIERFICAFDDPYNGARTFINNKRVRIKKCLSVTVDGIFHPFQTGIVYKITGGALFVATKQGSLVIKSVTGDDGTDMFSLIRPGDRFYTPTERIEAAKGYRAVYTPKGLHGDA